MRKKRKFEECRGVDRKIREGRSRSKAIEKNKEKEGRKQIQKDGITREIYGKIVV